MISGSTGGDVVVEDELVDELDEDELDEDELDDVELDEDGLDEDEDEDDVDGAEVVDDVEVFVVVCEVLRALVEDDGAGTTVCAGAEVGTGTDVCDGAAVGVAPAGAAGAATAPIDPLPAPAAPDPLPAPPPAPPAPAPNPAPAAYPVARTAATPSAAIFVPTFMTRAAATAALPSSRGPPPVAPVAPAAPAAPAQAPATDVPARKMSGTMTAGRARLTSAIS